MKRPNVGDIQKLVKAAQQLPAELGPLYFNAWCNLLQPTEGERRIRVRRRVIAYLQGRLDALGTESLSYNQAILLERENHTYGALYRATVISSPEPDSHVEGGDTDANTIAIRAAEQEPSTQKPSSPAGLVAPKMELDGQQLEAANLIYKWIKDPDSKQTFDLYGWAGTGKSYLMREVASWQRTVCCAYTGMASLNLSAQNLVASTINSLIYRSTRNEDTGEISSTLKDPSEIQADLIVVDECFMVPRDMGLDLEQLGIRLLRVGDSFQLPPIDVKNGVWADAERKPDVMLTEIRRQAKGNPIVYLATRVREGRELKYGQYGESSIITMDEVRRRRDELLMAHQGMSAVVCGINKTRRAYNNRMREIMGYAFDDEENYVDFPVAGETLLCLKNEKTRGIVNGQLWRVMEVGEPETIICKYPVVDRTSATGVTYRPSTWRRGEPGREGEPVRVTAILLKLQNPLNGDIIKTHVPVEFFNGDPSTLHWRQKSGTSEYDFGYVLTAHKAQGSTFDDTLVLDESWAFGETGPQWLYTAMTRPRNRLTVGRG